ncbi:hypothetical protein IT575_05190 [bacterium]|nr:hypothetical protein [bacterium]
MNNPPSRSTGGGGSGQYFGLGGGGRGGFMYGGVPHLSAIMMEAYGEVWDRSAAGEEQESPRGWKWRRGREDAEVVHERHG